MPLMTWNNTLSVGVIEMDLQHKRLIDMLNQLFDAMSTGQGAEVLKPVLGGLVQYTVTHFANEERYMKQFNYPDFARHKEEHDALTQKANELKNRLDKGQSMLSVETLTFLKTWLNTHIQGTDKKYSEFFNQNGLK